MIAYNTSLGVVGNGVQLDPKKYLPMARTILGYVAANMESGLGYSADRCVQGMNTQMNPAQKIYEVELHHAALLLWGQYPHISTGAWLVHLRNYLGHRIVEPVFCIATETLDPVTRACVPISEPEPEPIPPPIPPIVHIPDIPEEEATVIDKKWLYLGVAGLLVLFLRR